ncbi:translation initiation factor IF-2 N-terminal domain-containing protein [Saccharopolyspora cebuensis]|uniref:Translation initiation factor IF-2 N-terminal domain-containing protein n=1 Tax=Saccharopolyspora cebuensis TaxID=418759 RepID=A0ABV4CGD9_9PSEU
MLNMDTPAGSTSGQSATPDQDAQGIELPAKLRVHALAKLLGTSSREVIATLNSFGAEVRSAQSNIDRDTALRVAREIHPELVADADEQAPAPESAGQESAAQESAGQPAEEERTEVPEQPAGRPSVPDATFEAPAPSEPASTEPSPSFAAPQAMFLAPEPPEARPSTPAKKAEEPAKKTEEQAKPAKGPKQPKEAPAKGEQAPAKESAPKEAEEPRPEAEAESDEDSEQAGRRRRRRGRRGRGRGRGGDGDGGEAQYDESEDSEDTTAKPAKPAKPAEEEAEPEGGESNRRRRRRRRRKGGADDESGGREDDPPNTVVHVREAPEQRQDASSDDEVRAVKGSTRLEAKRQRRRDGREAGRRRAPVLSEAEFLARRESVDRQMVVRQSGEQTQIAVMEDGVLVENFVTSSGTGSLVGNVYLGRVQNVLPSMEAAFVDIGRGRNAVLYAGEVDWDAAGLAGKARRIEQALSTGDSVLVQVTKDPVGHKGARLTTQISLPGRFLVYVPGGGATGISRKLPDTERKRLKEILKRIVPENAGVIIRTASEGTSEEALDRDVRRLQAQWEVIKEKSEVKGAQAPQLLYEEPDLLIKVVRDLFTEDFTSLTIQGDDAWETIEAYVQHVAPDLMARLHKHVGKNDVFTEQRITEQISKALDRKVWLPSGGYLVIDRTEAMTVIDVNTGKFTGSGGNLEETVTRNNLEAAEEIVRQLRLRDIGGIIVIDFIDMVLESNRDLVLRRLTECLGRDRTRHQVAEVTSLGLVQMTRKRVGTGLLEAYSNTCEHCRGRGVIVSTDPVVHQHAGGGNGGGGGGRRNRQRGKQAETAEQEKPKQDESAKSEQVKPEAEKPAKDEKPAKSDRQRSKDDKKADKQAKADKQRAEAKAAEQRAEPERTEPKPESRREDRSGEQPRPEPTRTEAARAEAEQPEPQAASNGRARRKASRPAGSSTGGAVAPVVVANPEPSSAPAEPAPAVAPAAAVRRTRRAASRPAGAPGGGSAQG